MPARVREDKKEETHTHNWIKYNSVESYCSNLYYGKPCIKVGIGQDEYDRRLAEWEDYYKLAQSSQSKRDYEEMRVAYNDKDQEKMAEIKKRVETRVKRKEAWDEFNGEKFEFNESAYFAKEPQFPYPEDPVLPYVILT